MLGIDDIVLAGFTGGVALNPIFFFILAMLVLVGWALLNGLAHIFYYVEKFVSKLPKSFKNTVIIIIGIAFWGFIFVFVGLILTGKIR